MENINDITINSLEKEINILKAQRDILLGYVNKTSQENAVLGYIEKIEDRNSMVVQMAKYNTKKILVKK